MPPPNVIPCESPSGPAPQRDWRTIKEVAELRPWATERWLRYAITHDRIDHSKIGRRILVDLIALDAYVEANLKEAH